MAGVRAWLLTFWGSWDLRMFVLGSFIMQIILIFTGSIRKRTTRNWLRAVLWLAYLQADSVAISALGILSRTNGGVNDDLIVLWAPFLLLHLGGPDTITAFAIEDNELWPRHALNLVYQVLFAVYVYSRDLRKTRFLAPAVLMFLAGTLKYAERTWALFSASMDRLRSSMIKKPDPGPNYAKFMGEYSSKREAGIPANIIVGKEPHEAEQRTLDTTIEDLTVDELLHKSYEFVQVFKHLIVDLILSYQERNESQTFFLKRSPEQGFRVIETEISILYEMFYTKYPVMQTGMGRVFRIFTFFAILSSLIIFHSTSKGIHAGKDLVITYVLLVGAFVLECYSIVQLLFSERSCGTYFSCTETRRPKWSSSMAQCNLLSFCLRELEPPSITKRTMKLIGLEDAWEKFWHTDRCPVTPELKELLYSEIKSKAVGAQNSKIYRRFGSYRGEWALRMMGYLKEFRWSIEVEFDQSILLWHIATDLCYHTSTTDGSEKDAPGREISKQLSDYMLYLLIQQPFMLTAGIGQIRYGDTCAEAKNFLQQLMAEETAASNMLLEVDTSVPPGLVKGDRSQSVLFDGCILAKMLKELNARNRWDMISTVWVEMLGYAAGHCRGLYHAKQLGVGGELLTLVWLLMAHLGIGEQFKIEEGSARVKLIVGK